MDGWMDAQMERQIIDIMDGWMDDMMEGWRDRFDG